ncbi:MAG: hypothetical protein IPP08_05210 [Chlorobiota bacterium]|nr:hypothetical protein [Chlorobiota bacterium]QQS67564.1 MAG: hypothetical protein IPP08_05210 [Chlorobiota bacterium]
MYKVIFSKSFLAVLFSLVLLFLINLDEINAQRRGSFGGFRSSGRSSFGSSRGFSTPSYSNRSRPSFTQPNRTTTPSFGGTRSTTGNGGWNSTTTQRPSFGGKSISNSQEYTRSYGVPRKVERMNNTTQGGGNYVVNNYGGYGDNFMYGYLAGRTSMWWSTPFHPAYYYSRPYYHNNTDGTVSVYPPTFSVVSLFSAVIWIGILGVGIYVVYKIFFKKKNTYSNNEESFSSFG